MIIPASRGLIVATLLVLAAACSGATSLRTDPTGPQLSPADATTTPATPVPPPTVTPTLPPAATPDATAPADGPGSGDELDVQLEANFGDVELEPGFTPDPFQTEIISGGGVDVSYLGGGCTGFATAAPDFELRYGDGGSYLELSFTPDSDVDTALVINDPSGEWICNDDAEGLDPVIEITNPAGGVYDVWISSYNADESVAGTLEITELRSSSGGAGADGGLDTTADANFGDVELNPGFTPDPFETRIISGGGVDVSYLGGGCTGFATAAPDLELRYGDGGSYLEFAFTPDGGGDTALVINDPTGGWICNDDADGLNPVIDITDPEGGIYDVWIASFNADETVAGTLAISELR